MATRTAKPAAKAKSTATTKPGARAKPAAKSTPSAATASAAATSGPAWHTWSAKPGAREVEAHVGAFFAAIRANDGARAFFLCPHYEYGAPYVGAPDRKSIAKAVKLLRTVLTDNEVADRADDRWQGKLDVAGVSTDESDNVFAKIRYGAKPTPLTGLFKLIGNAGGWQLTFNMLRRFPGA